MARCRQRDRAGHRSLLRWSAVPTCAVMGLALAVALACLRIAAAQPALAASPIQKRPVMIGALTTSFGPTPHMAGLREGLTALGYREDEDFVIGVRFTQGEPGLLFKEAEGLIRDGADILFTVNEPAARAAQLATRNRPIVFTGVGEPDGQGLIASYSRPGGNMTGVADLDLTLSAKRLQEFSQLVPGLRRVLVPYVDGHPYQLEIVKRYREAAHRLGIVLVERPLRTQREAREAILGIRKGEVDGILAPRHADLNIQGYIIDATRTPGVPSMFDSIWFVEHGGLASYGTSIHASGVHAARLVDKIIRGERPGAIPVEVNNELEFVINLKVARELGLQVSRETLYRADRIIR